MYNFVEAVLGLDESAAMINYLRLIPRFLVLNTVNSRGKEIVY